MIDIKDKVVIITGAGQGIGKVVALKFADAGAKVVVSDINEENVNKVVEEIKARGVESIGFKTNVVNSEECDALIAKTKEAFGRIDAIVNNAGITKDNLIVRMSDEDWDAVINVNLKGVFNCTRAATKVMMKQKSGSIINMASVVGVIGNAGQANYSASKGGVIMLSKTVAKEYAGRGVRVNAIAPGFIDTEMTKAIPEKQRDMMISTIPLKRLGQPEDIAHACLFLASDMSSYITGQVLIVDGGMAI